MKKREAEDQRIQRYITDIEDLVNQMAREGKLEPMESGHAFVITEAKLGELVMRIAKLTARMHQEEMEKLEKLILKLS